MAVAQSDEQCRAVVAQLLRHQNEQRVAHRRNDDSLAGIVRESAFAQGFHALQSRENQTQRQQQEKRARARRDAHRLFAVDGEIVAQNAVAEAEANHVHGQQPTLQEEESVERNGLFVFQNLPFARLNRRIDEKSDGRNGEGHPEEQVEVVDVAIDEDAHGGRNGRGDVVAQAVVANALVSSRRGQHVDGHGAVGHGCRAEGCAVDCADDGEKQQRGGQQIGAEAEEVEKQAQEQHFLAWKTVGKVAAEGSHHESRERVARQYESNHALRGAEILAQVERQQRREQIKGERQREVGCHHSPVVGVPESFLRFHRAQN